MAGLLLSSSQMAKGGTRRQKHLPRRAFPLRILTYLGVLSVHTTLILQCLFILLHQCTTVSKSEPEARPKATSNQIQRRGRSPASTRHSSECKSLHHPCAGGTPFRFRAASEPNFPLEAVRQVKLPLTLRRLSRNTTLNLGSDQSRRPIMQIQVFRGALPPLPHHLTGELTGYQPHLESGRESSLPGSVRGRGA